MHRRRALRASCATGVAAAAIAVLACSSESPTGPSLSKRVELAAHLDSARAGSTGQYAGVLLNILQAIALGAPLDSVRLTINGKTATYPMVAAYYVQSIAGRPFDSVYLIDAWSSAVDTVWALDEHSGSALGFATRDTTLAASSTTMSGTVTASAPFGSCTSLRTEVPTDVAVPNGFVCKQQRVSTTMSGRLVLESGNLDVTMPSQQIAGVHLVANQE